MAATYTVKQVAEILGYSTNSIYTFLKENRIKGIRVGKGRFRIPQSELDRLLMSSKKHSTSFENVVPSPVATGSTPATGVADVSGGTLIEHTKVLGFVHLGTLNIFDWFIGTAAIVSGLGLFLFNTSLTMMPLGESSPFLSAMRTILIGSGIGILGTNVTGHTHTFWHKFFHVLLGGLGSALSVLFWMQGDIDGSLVYGGMAALVILSTFIKVGGVAWMSLYISFLTVATNVTILLAWLNPRIQTLFSMIPFSWEAVMAIGSISGGLFLFALWFGYFKSKQLFWLATWTAAFWYFVVAFWYAADIYWSRSFFFLVVGVTCLYLSPWEWLAAIKNRKADLFTLGVFSAVFGILLAGIAAVYLMQMNGITTIKRENVYKVKFAQHDLETTIDSVLGTLTGARNNPKFAEAVEKKDLEYLNNSERIMFESNEVIRRLVLLDANGKGINLYPFGTFDQEDLSFRDYFVHARDVGTPFVTDVFEALTDQSHKKVVSVATPLYGTNREFIGVLAASLDLEGISVKLQKIAVPERNEYIVVIDSKGKRMIHPEMKLIGIQIDGKHPVLASLKGKSGVELGTMYDGQRAVTAYEPILKNGVNWGIGITSPISKVYQLTDVSNLSIFSVIVAAVIMAGAILQGGFFYKWKVQISGDSP